MIAIVDYGMGNLRSVQKAFQFAGFDAIITEKATDIADASHIVLPGVGAFCDAANLLYESGLAEVIKKEVVKGKPFLGICLGMQLLFSYSQEGQRARGLELIEGDCVKFCGDAMKGLKIPHIGWNTLDIKLEKPIFEGVFDKSFYFVHSYYVRTAAQFVSATTSYGVDFVSAVQKDNVFGVQFHPEKSGDTGQILIKNFGGLK